MFGINGYEFLLLAAIAVLVLGPDRLPEYAAQLGRLVKNVRRMASGARDQLREEVGPELDDVDWRKLDPRQYDPRRIVREALLDDLEDPVKPVSKGAPGATPNAAVQPRPSVVKVPGLVDGQSAPFDAEAT